MSDLFNHGLEPEQIDAFNARDHIISLCGNGRVQVVEYAGISYKKGWTHIIESLIDNIRRLPVRITSISSDFGELDIGFDCYERTQEVRVWRAMDQARFKSSQTCWECGFSARREVKNEKVVVICKDCVNVAAQNGVTGTWLDKY